MSESKTNRNLSGYQLKVGYFLELEHGLVGTFPAIFTSTDTVVICLNLRLLQEVWKLLEKREAKVSKVLLLAKDGEYFRLDLYKSGKAELFHVLSEDEFNDLDKGREPFSWAPGLFDLKHVERVTSPFGRKAIAALSRKLE